MGLRAVLAVCLALAALAAAGGSAAALASGCPATAPAPPEPAGMAGPLVSVQARSVLLCRYHGLDPAASAHHLLSAHLVTVRAQAASIAAAIDALPALSRLVHCPMDDDSEIVATFRYASGGHTAVRIGLLGCRTVTGPTLPIRTAANPAGQRLLTRLERLLH
jgi:hypothetical protein